MAMSEVCELPTHSAPSSMTFLESFSGWIEKTLPPTLFRASRTVTLMLSFLSKWAAVSPEKPAPIIITDPGFLLASVFEANKGGLANKLVPAIVVPMMNFRLSMIDVVEEYSVELQA